MDKLNIPFYEKEKGTHHFSKKEYSDAIKAYSKVNHINFTKGITGNFISSKGWLTYRHILTTEILG